VAGLPTSVPASAMIVPRSGMRWRLGLRLPGETCCVVLVLSLLRRWSRRDRVEFRLRVAAGGRDDAQLSAGACMTAGSGWTTTICAGAADPASQIDEAPPSFCRGCPLDLAFEVLADPGANLTTMVDPWPSWFCGLRVPVRAGYGGRTCWLDS